MTEEYDELDACIAAYMEALTRHSLSSGTPPEVTKAIEKLAELREAKAILDFLEDQKDPEWIFWCLEKTKSPNDEYWNLDQCMGKGSCKGIHGHTVKQVVKAAISLE